MHVEFLGIPRQRAGVTDLEIEAGTLGELLRELADRFPRLRELVVDGQFHPSVVANLNGDEFVSEPGRVFNKHDHLLILSADVGG
jgi:molybdopterin converting factor small subunit